MKHYLIGLYKLILIMVHWFNICSAQGVTLFIMTCIKKTHLRLIVWNNDAQSLSISHVTSLCGPQITGIYHALLGHLVFFFIRKHIHLSIILVKLQCLQFRYLTCSIAFSASKKLVLIVNFGLMLAPPRVT